jgi:hypothetical protein
MPALAKGQRKELEEGLAATYPHLSEPQLLGYLLDVYKRDFCWLNDRMQAELRKEKCARKAAPTNAASEEHVPAS